MIIFPVKTHKITTEDKDILAILDKYLPEIKEKSVVAVTSKIISFTQGQAVQTNSIEKEKLIEKEADLYLPRSSSKYDVQFTIKNNILTANAGIDESNANRQYILWPKDIQETVNKIREHLVQKFSLKFVGVIITDSKATPLRWGVTGISLAHSGFNALKNYIGEKDLFGRQFRFEKLNITDSLAASAVLEMGEGSEQTPIAIIENLPQIEFQDRNPNKEELDGLKIDLQDDLYAPLLKTAKWERGKD